MKKSIFILLLWGFYLPLLAQKTIEIDSSFQRKEIIDLSEQTLFLLDLTKQKTIDDIRKSQFQGFNRLPDFNHTSRYKANVWLRFQLRNFSKTDTLKALFSAGSSFRTSVYIFDNQKLVNQASNDKLLPDQQRPFRFDGQYLPIIIPPKATYDFYVEISRFSMKKIRIQPTVVTYEWEAKKKESDLYDNRFAIGSNYALLGILLFLALFTFLQYLLNRQRYILYYSLYLFAMSAFVAWGFEHSSYGFFLLKYSSLLLISLRQNFYVLVAQFCYFLFIGEFLASTHSHPRIGKTNNFLLKSIGILIALEVLFTLILQRYDWEVYLSIFTQVFLSVLGALMLFYVYQIKTKLAFYIKIGSTFLLLGGIFGFISSWMNWVPQSSDLLDHYPNVYFNACILLEILFFSMGLAYKATEVIHQKNDLEQAVSLSELNTLRLQINPHFLFNSLNSIKSYIIKNKTDEAADYLTDFSTLIRSILQKSKEQVVTLKEELDTILLYTKLEQLRFQKKFNFIFEISPEIDTENIMIPALLLQPYIENAIKHGLTNKKEKGTLQLIVRDLEENIEILIDDDGIGRKRATELKSNSDGHQSMGLKINEERLKLLNKIHGWDIHCQIMDKFDSKNQPIGTKIILTIPK
ncbi:MAG: histidine kinase [Emticicia sp.]|uniref:histidine kinase n=1 Tax=Emticicia sp. TaxID=1930953 RepID=UPI003BA58B70